MSELGLDPEPVVQPAQDGGGPLEQETRLFDVTSMTHFLTMAEKFTLPPFSIINTRDGWWQGRKRMWKNDVGLRSLAGREGIPSGAWDRSLTEKELAKMEAAKTDPTVKMPVGWQIIKLGEESIFDPVLTELCYRWFCPADGRILDPFAGGSVRGVVAAWLGREYVGVDLSERQCEANAEQAKECDVAAQEGDCEWLCGDSAELITPDLGEFDFVFSCPPYHDLEQYSDDPRDLSNVSWEKFCEQYREIIRRSVEQLIPNRFAAWVVSEIRGPDGAYRNFVGETVEAFEAAGARYYNELVLVGAVGSIRLTAARHFAKTRKAGRMHQNVLVFLKGDAKEAVAALPEIPSVVLEEPSADVEEEAK